MPLIVSAVAPVQPSGETGGRCGRRGWYQIPPFLCQSGLAQIDAVHCGTAETRAACCETGCPECVPFRLKTRRQEIQNMHFCTHLPFYIRPFSLHIFLFIRNLPRSSITFLVNCSFLYLIEGLLCNLCGAGNTSQHARSHLYNKSWYRVMIPYDVVTFTVAVSQIDTSERWRVCLHCIY